MPPDLLNLQLPYMTPELPAIGGRIKVEPADFVVEEIPLYQPCGSGEHVYVTLRRSGWTTRELQRRLAKLFGLPEWAVGCAGLKDRRADVTQTFSLHLPQMDESTVSSTIEQHLPVTVERVVRHSHKLRTGHLRGNRFRIRVRGVGPDALERAQAIAAKLLQRGIANFYGEQRFGMNADNALRGLEILRGRRARQRWQRRFYLSALQSALFNLWLVRRLEREWFDRLFPGDVACKIETGGLFRVENVEVETARLHRREITLTGPIFGTRMLRAEGEPGELEMQVLQAVGLTLEQFAAARLEGTRRIARFWLDEICIEAGEDDLWFSFALPPGAYATIVLREFLKPETP